LYDRNIVVCSLQDGHFLKIIKQLAHNGKINMYSSPTNTDDYKSDDKVHILPKQCFSKYPYPYIYYFCKIPTTYFTIMYNTIL